MCQAKWTIEMKESKNAGAGICLEVSVAIQYMPHLLRGMWKFLLSERFHKAQRIVSRIYYLENITLCTVVVRVIFS